MRCTATAAVRSIAHAGESCAVSYVLQAAGKLPPVNAQRTRDSESRACRSMAIYCVTVHNQPQYIVPEIFVQNAHIHRPV